MSVEISRIYSISQIRHMAKEGFSDEYLKYLKTAPKGVKEILASWGSQSIIIEELRKQEQKVSMSGEELEKEEQQGPAFDEGVEEIKEEAVIKKNIETSELDNEDILKKMLIKEYDHIEFKQRIDVSGFYISIWDEIECPVHNIPLKRTQVVALADTGGKYGMMINACKECKRLYISKQSFVERLNGLNSKKIPYVIEGDLYDETNR